MADHGHHGHEAKKPAATGGSKSKFLESLEHALKGAAGDAVLTSGREVAMFCRDQLGMTDARLIAMANGLPPEKVKLFSKVLKATLVGSQFVLGLFGDRFAVKAVQEVVKEFLEGTFEALDRAHGTPVTHAGEHAHASDEEVTKAVGETVIHVISDEIYCTDTRTKMVHQWKNGKPYCPQGIVRPPRPSKDGKSFGDESLPISLSKAVMEKYEPCPHCFPTGFIVPTGEAAHAPAPKAEAKGHDDHGHHDHAPTPVPAPSADNILAAFFKEGPANRKAWNDAIAGLPVESQNSVRRHLKFLDSRDELDVLLPAMKEGGAALALALEGLKDGNDKLRLAEEGAEVVGRIFAFLKKVDGDHVKGLVDRLQPPKKGPWGVGAVVIGFLAVMYSAFSLWEGEREMVLWAVGIGAILTGIGLVIDHRSKAALARKSLNVIALPFAFLDWMLRLAKRAVLWSIATFMVSLGLPLAGVAWAAWANRPDLVMLSCIVSVVLVAVATVVLLLNTAILTGIAKVSAGAFGAGDAISSKLVAEAKDWIMSTAAWYVGIYWIVYRHPTLTPVLIGELLMASAFLAFVRLVPWFEKAIFRPFAYAFAVIAIVLTLGGLAFPETNTTVADYVWEKTGIELEPQDLSDMLLIRQKKEQIADIRMRAVKTTGGHVTPQEADTIVTLEAEIADLKNHTYWGKQAGFVYDESADGTEGGGSPSSPVLEREAVLNEMRAAEAL